jgi:hypothetical protein
MNVAAIWFEVDDGIPNRLTGSMVGDVAATPGLKYCDPTGIERLRGREDVRSPAIASHAERQNMRVLDEQQRVADPSGPTVFDQCALQRERVCVRHQAESADG